jgi:hypothetical protein
MPSKTSDYLASGTYLIINALSINSFAEGQFFWCRAPRYFGARHLEKAKFGSAATNILLRCT